MPTCVSRRDCLVGQTDMQRTIPPSRILGLGRTSLRRLLALARHVARHVVVAGCAAAAVAAAALTAPSSRAGAGARAAAAALVTASVT